MADYTHPAKAHTDNLTDTFENPPVSQSPVTKTRKRGKEYRLYNLLEATRTSEYGMYVLTTQSDDKPNETIYKYGKIGMTRNIPGNIPSVSKLENYIEDDNTVTLLKKNFQDGDLRNSLRNYVEREFQGVFGDSSLTTYGEWNEFSRDSAPVSEVQIDGRTAFIPSGPPKFLSGDDEPHVGKDAWDAYQEHLHDRHGDVLNDEFEGIRVRLTFDDWRETADDLAYKSVLSSQQAVAWSIAQQGFNGSQIASLLNKDESTVSRQLTDAAKKYQQAKTLAKETDAPNNLKNHIQKARGRIHGEIANRNYERNKTPVTDPLRCPNCGRDAGELEGDAQHYEMIPGREFIRTYMDHPQHGTGGPKVICPDCDEESTQSEFVSEWKDEHGKIPKPDIDY